jgi:hypothetical protein
MREVVAQPNPMQRPIRVQMAPERICVEHDENDIIKFLRNNLKPRKLCRAKDRFTKNQHILFHTNLRSPERHPIIVVDISGCSIRDERRVER